MEAQKKKMEVGLEVEVEVLNENDGAEPSRKKKKTYDLFAAMDDDPELAQVSSSALTQREAEMDEVKRYLRETCQHKDSDPLAYWSRNAAESRIPYPF
jgi:hypothetical protein